MINNDQKHNSGTKSKDVDQINQHANMYTEE